MFDFLSITQLSLSIIHLLFIPSVPTQYSSISYSQIAHPQYTFTIVFMIRTNKNILFKSAFNPKPLLLLPKHNANINENNPDLCTSGLYQSSLLSYNIEEIIILKNRSKSLKNHFIVLIKHNNSKKDLILLNQADEKTLKYEINNPSAIWIPELKQTYQIQLDTLVIKEVNTLFNHILNKNCYSNVIIIFK